MAVQIGQAKFQRQPLHMGWDLSTRQEQRSNKRLVNTQVRTEPTALQSTQRTEKIHFQIYI